MSVQPGQMLSHYRVVEKIGEGGMGEVYRSEDTQLNRDVAIKVLPASMADHPLTLARFEREAKAVAALSHPNILAVYEFGSVDGRPFVVTELLEGETLRSRLDQGTLAPHKAIDLGRQTARGLAAAHEKGIIHRDLKPENLFITRDGRAKILDFGLATEGNNTSPEGFTVTPTRTSLTSPGTVMGTVGYMSPEQVRGKDVDARSDIFSLGTILYETLTGRRAFMRDTQAETMTAILREEPEDVTRSSTHVSPGLAAIVRRCLEKQPGERFQSASDLAFSLQTQSDTSVSSPSTAAVDDANVLPRRSPLARVAAALLIGVAVGAAVMAAFNRPQPTPGFELMSRRHGTILHGRFTADGHVLYSAAWDGNPLGVFSIAAGARESRELPFTGADLFSVSVDRELALSLGRRFTMGWEATGTLAVASPNSAPRELLENVLDADWAPDGEELAVVREVDGNVRLEYPAGTVLYESPGWISRPRVHPDGDRIAFVDHPGRGDSSGTISIVDRSGTVERLASGGGPSPGWSPDGREIWYAQDFGLYAVRPGVEPRMIYRSPVELLLLDVARDGRVLMASTSLRREMVARAPGSDRDVNLSWLSWTVARDITDDGRTVLFEEGGETEEDGYPMYIRGTDGSTPVQIGYGLPIALSPDARWVLAMKGYFTDSPMLVTVPTGPGQVRTLSTGNLRIRQWGDWLPGPTSGDDAAILFAGQEPGGPVRIYRVSLAADARPQPVTPAQYSLSEWGAAVSSDGARLVALPAGGTPLEFPLDGSEPVPLPGIEAGDLPLRFHQDGRHLFVHAASSSPARVVRLNIETGKRTPWRDLAPLDPAGVFNVDRISLSADGEAHVYAYRRITSTLLVANGLE